MTKRWFALTLGGLMACGAVDKEGSTDTDGTTEEPAETDSNTDTPTDTPADTDADTTTDTPADTDRPAEVARVRFRGTRDSYLSQSLVSIRALLDGEPISAAFDAGMESSDLGWFYPGSDDAVALPVGEHELTLTAIYEVPPCPECPPAQVEGSTSYTLDLEAGTEQYVHLWVTAPDRTGVATSIWTVDDTRARAGGAAVRLVGGPVPRQPLFTEELTITLATGGCVNRGGVMVSPLWGTTQMISAPADDSAETWIGLLYTNPFGPSSTGWYQLPDRPAGEVLNVYALTMSVAPATEGAGLPVSSGDMTWPLCPAGPS